MAVWCLAVSWVKPQEGINYLEVLFSDYVQSTSRKILSDFIFQIVFQPVQPDFIAI